MEPVEPVQMNIYHSNTYRKDLSWLHFDNEPRVQERQQVKDQQSYISISVAYPAAPSCYLEFLVKLQKRICRTVGPSLASSLELLAHHRNVASLSLFYRYYFGRCSSELAQLVPLPYSRGRYTRYSDRLHDFSVTIPRCYKDDYVSSFFPRTARLWNSLPIECFPLTYDLSGFKSRINRYLLTVGSF